MRIPDPSGLKRQRSSGLFSVCTLESLALGFWLTADRSIPMHTLPHDSPKPTPTGHTPPSHRRFWPSLVVLVFFLVSQGNLARIIGPLDPSFMAMQFAFSPTRYAEILAAWGPVGIERYRSHFVFDLMHPLIFAALGWIAVRTSPVFEGLSPRRERILSWLLPVAAGLDYIENTCQLKRLSAPPGTGEWLIPTSAACATIKWTLAAMFTLTFVWRFVVWMVRRPLSQG